MELGCIALLTWMCPPAHESPEARAIGVLGGLHHVGTIGHRLHFQPSPFSREWGAGLKNPIYNHGLLFQ